MRPPRNPVIRKAACGKRCRHVCLPRRPHGNQKDAYRQKSQDKNQVMTYYFDVERCHACPQAQGCYKDGAKSKTYNVTIKSGLHKKQTEFQETESFKELARTRYKIEAKNSELKHRHGYDVASSSGLVGMQLQGTTTIFVTNLKESSHWGELKDLLFRPFSHIKNKKRIRR